MFYYYMIKNVLDKCCYIDNDGLFNGISYPPFELDGVAYIQLYTKPKHSHSIIMIETKLPETNNVKEMTEQEAQNFINEHRITEVNNYGLPGDKQIIKPIENNFPVIIKDYKEFWDKPDKNGITLKQRARATIIPNNFNRRENRRMTSDDEIKFEKDKAERGYCG